ncbi:hypothetical protein M2191_004401 [Bradyrhizobium japonicum]|nr:hypothetical protein [Bradyrhizobium japonicum]
MRPTTADENVFDFNALLHPGTVFEAPRDVLDHPALTLAEKRAILASWASKASAIASCPSMRPCRPQEAGVDRRDLGRLVRPGRWPRTPPGGKPYRLHSTERAAPRRSLGGPDDDGREPGAHHNNISRYRRLLRTKLSPLERQFIERRLSEEEAALQSLSASTFPIVLKEPRPGRPLPTRGLLLVPQDDFTL